MKKVYESPKMVAEVFKASQAVAGNCKPGVREGDVKAFSVKCSSNEWGHGHFFGLGSSVNVFTKESNGCELVMSEANLTDSGTLAGSKSYTDLQNHNYVVANNNEGYTPYYFIS